MTARFEFDRIHFMSLPSNIPMKTKVVIWLIVTSVEVNNVLYWSVVIIWIVIDKRTLATKHSNPTRRYQDEWNLNLFFRDSSFTKDLVYIIKNIWEQIQAKANSVNKVIPYVLSVSIVPKRVPTNEKSTKDMTTITKVIIKSALGSNLIKCWVLLFKSSMLIVC